MTVSLAMTATNRLTDRRLDIDLLRLVVELLAPEIPFFVFGGLTRISV